jgi:hypothetical protein
MAQSGDRGEPAVLRVLQAFWQPDHLPCPQGKLIRLEKEQTVIGRSPDCDLHLPDVSISRMHCWIVRQGNVYTLEDRHSTNGTYLNGQRTNGVAPLSAGDRIRIQGVLLSFERPFDGSLRFWDGGTIVRLAEAAYGEVLDDGSLDPIRLSILADALTDAGADDEFVSHLREPGPHYAGCWAMEAILGICDAVSPEPLGAACLLPSHAPAGQLARQKRSPSGCWAIDVVPRSL